MGVAEGDGMSATAAQVLRLSDLVHHVRGPSRDGAVVEILLERADRVLATDGGRDCDRPLTGAEVDLLLAGEPRNGTGPRP